MKKRIAILFITSVVVLLALSGCIPGDGSYTATKTAGFFWGIWHGWLAPFSLIIGIFDKNIRLYEINNKGWWYDFGSYIAIISGFGGLSFYRSYNRNH